MKKRVLSILLVLCMALALLPGTAWAAATSGKCGANVTWSYSNGTLTIQGNGSIEDYVYWYRQDFLTAPWNDYRSKIHTVEIGYGVTRIGEHAFSVFPNLTSVTIPSSVLAIGKFAFSDCDSLTSVTIPNGVTTIEYGAFSGCRSLTNVTIPTSVTTIKDEAFGECRSLTSVTIPASITTIENGVFMGCGLNSVTIPNSVTTIEMYAFLRCSNLTSVTIPASVTKIDNDAFRECESLRDVYYGGSESRWRQVSIGERNDPLRNSSIHYTYTPPSGKCGANLTWSLSNGTLTIQGTGKMDDYDYEPDPTPWDAYRNEILSVKISNGVTAIGAAAFQGCSNLTSVTIPDSVTAIEYGSFSGCSSLTGVVIPNSVTTIGTRAFRDCHSLKSIAIPAGITRIDPMAFVNCLSLTSAIIPSSVTKIGMSAFDNCNSLRDVYFGGSESQWKQISVDSGSLYNIGKNGNAPLLNAKIHYNSALAAFNDVSASEYYTDAIAWAVEKGVTSGTGNGAFSPESDCTRAQIVTFLWRAYGEPEPTSTVNQFTDVNRDAYYYKAVLWAAENGVTSGTGGTNFGINGDCTRAQAVTFLWRAAGQPTAKSNSSFSDVDSGAYYAEAVKWAVENNITSGTGNGRFSPDQVCTRAQIVTFLYWNLEGIS